MRIRLDIAAVMSARILWTSITLLCLVARMGAQVPASFQVPILGYVFESNTHNLHPIVGIAGSSRIDGTVDLGGTIEHLEILPGQRQVIAATREMPHLLVINLENRSATIDIAGAPSGVSSIRISADGRSAAFHYQAERKLLIVGGLPEAPVIQNVIDLSFLDSPLSRYSISDDGTFALLAFSDEQQDVLYRWEKERRYQFVATFGRVADIAFIDNDAVVADASAGQVVVFRNIRGQSTPTLVADSREGLSQPVALSISKRHEILVADAGARAVFTLDSDGRLLRSLPCGCLPTGLSRLGDYSYRLTNRLDQPIILFDDSSGTPRTLFVPALTPSVETLP